MPYKNYVAWPANGRFQRYCPGIADLLDPTEKDREGPDGVVSPMMFSFCVKREVESGKTEEAPGVKAIGEPDHS